MMLNVLIGLCVFLSHAVWADGDSCPVSQHPMRIAMNAPKSSPQLSDATKQDNSELLSNMTVLVIHRTTCPHCMHLMKDVFSSFSQSSAKYGIKTQPKIQYIDGDTRDGVKEYQSFVDSKRIQSSVNGVPAVILLDGNGQEISPNCRIVGYSNEQSFFTDLIAKAKVCK
jgi:thioredoxin-related protein